MKKLLIIEWIKLSSKVSTWLFIVLYAFLISVIYTIFLNFNINVQGEHVKISDTFDLNIQNVWEINLFFSSYLVWFFVFIVVSLTADDLRHNIWKQHIVEGLTRNQIMQSKIMLILILAVVGSVISGSIAFISCLKISDSFTFSDLHVIIDLSLRYYLYLSAIMLLSLAVLVFIKNASLSIIVLLGWFWFVEPIIRWIDKSNSTQFLIANSINDLITNPIFKHVEGFEFQLDSDYAIIASMVWVITICGILFFKINKSDL